MPGAQAVDSRLKHPLLPWIIALTVAASLTCGYVLSFALRRVWQTHYPELVSRCWTNNGSFTVLAVYGSELGIDEMLYAARVNEASRRLRTFDPYIKENHSFRLFTRDPITFFLMGAVARAVGNLSWAWILMRFLAAGAWFLLIHRIILETTESSPAAIFGGVFMTGFGYLVMVNIIPQLTFHGGLSGILLHNIWTCLSYGRTESVLRLARPGVTYIFKYLACLVAARAAQRGTWKWAWASGIYGGLLAYIRLDIWTTYIPAAFIFAGVYWLKRRRWEPVAFSAALEFVIGLPFLYFNFPPIPEQMKIVGVVFKREFHLETLLFLAAFLGAVRFKEKPLDLFLGCFLAGAFILVNIELLTGYDLSSFHWLWIGRSLLFLAVFSFLPKSLLKRKAPWLAASALAVGVMVVQSVGYAAVHYPFQGNPKDYDDAMGWLRAHSPDDSVVMSLNPEVMYMVPSFTHNKVLMSNIIPFISDIPLLESTRRLLTGLDILGADRARFIRECLQGLRVGPGHIERRDISGTGIVRGDLDKGDIYGTLFFHTPHAEVQALLKQAEGDFKKSKFEVDYVWFGHLEREYAASDFPRRSPLPLIEVYRNSMVTLYQVQPKNILK